MICKKLLIILFACIAINIHSQNSIAVVAGMGYYSFTNQPGFDLNGKNVYLTKSGQNTTFFGNTIGLNYSLNLSEHSKLGLGIQISDIKRIQQLITRIENNYHDFNLLIHCILIEVPLNIEKNINQSWSINGGLCPGIPILKFIASGNKLQSNIVQGRKDNYEFDLATSFGIGLKASKTHTIKINAVYRPFKADPFFQKEGSRIFGFQIMNVVSLLKRTKER